MILVLTHCVVNETLYRRLKEKGYEFENTNMNIILSDALQRNIKVYKTKVYINIESRTISSATIHLPLEKNNRTLLRTEFYPKLKLFYMFPTKTRISTEIFKKKFHFSEDFLRSTEISILHFSENAGKRPSE